MKKILIIITLCLIGLMNNRYSETSNNIEKENFFKQTEENYFVFVYNEDTSNVEEIIEELTKNTEVKIYTLEVEDSFYGNVDKIEMVSDYQELTALKTSLPLLVNVQGKVVNHYFHNVQLKK